MSLTSLSYHLNEFEKWIPRWASYSTQILLITATSIYMMYTYQSRDNFCLICLTIRFYVARSFIGSCGSHGSISRHSLIPGGRVPFSRTDSRDLAVSYFTQPFVWRQKSPASAFESLQVKGLIFEIQLAGRMDFAWVEGWLRCISQRNLKLETWMR